MLAIVALNGVEIIERAVWGANLPPAGPLETEAAGDVRVLLVHHTVSSNSYAEGDVASMLAGFYSYHTGPEKGWPDLAYNFCVDRFGRIWETRQGSIEAPVIGSATGGNQGFTQLCAFIGDHSVDPPTPAALDAMGRLLGALAAKYSVDVRPGVTASFVSRGSNLHPAGSSVTVNTITGHRSMSMTACPGDAVMNLIEHDLAPRALQASGGAPAVTSTTSTLPPTTEAPTSAPTTEPSTTATTAPTTSTPTTGAATTSAPTTQGSTTTSPGTADELGLQSSAQDASGSGGWKLAGPPALIAAGLAGLVALRRRGEHPPEGSAQ